MQLGAAFWSTLVASRWYGSSPETLNIYDRYSLLEEKKQQQQQQKRMLNYLISQITKQHAHAIISLNDQENSRWLTI